jgi:glutaredoxin 2
MEQINIKQTSPLHKEWLRKLDFYHFELFMLKEQLDEIAEENTDSYILGKAEHFTGLLNTLKSYIESLRNRVRENQNSLAFDIANEHTIEKNLKIFDLLNEECIAQQQAVNELRKKFDHFVAERV